MKIVENLLKVKSIVTLVLILMLPTVVVGGITMQDNMFQLFSNALMLVLGFYFGKKDTPMKEE